MACQWCGETHVTPREIAHRIAMRYPITICFVNRVIDQCDGSEAKAIKWLDVWSPIGIYITPEQAWANINARLEEKQNSYRE